MIEEKTKKDFSVNEDLLALKASACVVSRYIFRNLMLSTANSCVPGTENLHLVFSYSVWVLRDFPEDGLKVSLALTSALSLRFLVQCMI